MFYTGFSNIKKNKIIFYNEDLSIISLNIKYIKKYNYLYFIFILFLFLKMKNIL